MNSATGMGNFTGALSTGVAAFCAALNIFLSITATLGNALTLIALQKVSSIQPPRKMLFRCLAVTDLFVGVLTQPLLVHALLSSIVKNTNNVNHLQVVGNTSGIILCGVSLTTTTTISVDRLLALKLGLTYQQYVTIRRVRRAIILLWFGSIGVGSLSIFNTVAAMTITITSIVICVIISAFSYTKISIRLRQNQAQVQSHVQPEQGSAGGTPLNIERYRKTVSSIAWIQLALAVCYTPYLIVSVIIITGWIGTVADVAWISVLTLVYLNSSLNPILYCWKIRQVRQAMKAMVKQILCCGC